MEDVLAHDVFISYATEDKATADAVCAGLEKKGIACWIAPRDIDASEAYDDEIVKGITAARMMVVIFSASIFQSQYVKSEVECAFSKRARIFPFRIEDVLPRGGYELYLKRSQWLDAIHPPLEDAIARLAASIQKQFDPPAEDEPASNLPLGIPQPPEPARLPLTPGFVGREAELEAFGQRLASRHLAVICGMPGAGKTTFAVNLAVRHARDPNQIFWHAFHPGESVSVLVWKLAGFLARRGQPGLWEMMQGAQITGSPLLPLEVLIDYLFEMLQGGSYWLCLDNFQYIEGDPLLAHFTGHLETAAAEGRLNALVVSSRQPSGFSPTNLAQPLEGLSLDEARLLLNQRRLTLSDDLLARLYQRTEGNAQFLTLALDALRHTQDPSRLIGRLSECENIEDYLIKTVDEKLNEDERSLLGAVAVFLGYPASRAALSAVLEGRSLRRTLNELSKRYLLSVSPAGDEQEYSLTGMMQSFYYDLLSKSQQKSMHRLAAEFYANQEPALLQASIHFQRAGEERRAIALATGDVWAMLNLGQAIPLGQLLDNFPETERDPLQAAQLDLARGQVAAFLGGPQAARGHYEAAQSRLLELGDERDVLLLRARIYRGLGELLEGDEPHKALEWLQLGLDTLAAGDQPAETGALRIRMGRIRSYLGDFTAAQAALQQGLAEIAPGPSRARITALGNLGSLACLQRNVPLGLEYYRQVLDIARQINDHWSMVEVELNIGIELDISGQLSEAAAHYQAALEQAQKLGSLAQQARSLSSLGILHTKLGDYPRAEQELMDGTALARRAGLQAYLVYYLPSLADLRLRQQWIDAAIPLLEEAEQLAQETGAGDVEALPEIYRLWAQVRLADHDPDGALDWAKRALAQARDLEMETDQGVGLRVLGQVQLALGRKAEAVDCFAQSLAFLDGHDPYETARTRAAWGASLLDGSDRERGLELLRDAQTAFVQLGAGAGIAAGDGGLSSVAP